MSAPVVLAFDFLQARDRDPSRALAIAAELANRVIEGPAPKMMPLSREAELDRIVSLDEAAELQSSSRDSVIREDRARVAAGKPSRIIRLSDRRVGIRLRHALRLDD